MLDLLFHNNIIQIISNNVYKKSDVNKISNQDLDLVEE